MKILLDLDVLLDFALDREPFAPDAAALLGFLESHPGAGLIAWHSIANFYYLVAPRRTRRGAKEFLTDLAQFVDVAATDAGSLRYAARLRMRDFEDSMQVAAAAAGGAEIIATRNLRDYRNSPISTKVPAEVLRELEKAI